MGLSEFSTLFGLNTGEVFGASSSPATSSAGTSWSMCTHIYMIYIYILYLYTCNTYAAIYVIYVDLTMFLKSIACDNSCTSHKPFPHHRSGHLPTHRLLQDRCHLDHRHHQQARLMHLLIGESWCGVNKYLGAGAHVYTSYYFIFI